MSKCQGSPAYFSTYLKGYTGFAVHKAKSPAAAFGASPDGVALFWKTEKWEAVEPPLQWTDRGVVCAQLLKHCDSRQQLRVR